MESLSTIIGNQSVGIVGVGLWGKHLVETLQPQTSHPVLQSDWKRAAKEPNFPHVPLSELTEQSDIIFIAADLDAIPEIIREMRDKFRKGQIVIDIGSSKRGHIDLMREIDNDGKGGFGSIDPMRGGAPNPPSHR